MCGGPETIKPSSTPSTPPEESKTQTLPKGMNNLSVETEDSFSSLLELAANNDFDGFKRSIERDASAIDHVELWYGRQKGSNQMVLEHRTPLMVAATYGSIEVLKLILSLSSADVNRSCGPDKSTALHCAASGGSVNAVDAVKLLLLAGADPNALDANGRRPSDVILVSHKLPTVKIGLEELLNSTDSTVGEHHLHVLKATSNSNWNSNSPHLHVLTATSNSNSDSPPLSSSPESGSPSSSSDSTSSPRVKLFNELPAVSEKKEYPIDPSLPDIKNSIYSTDEFRMFSFKVRPCSRAYSHDWTECPFVHPGENARRRDPRKFHYSCVPCPDFRKGACRRSDMCEYAHGVFECWLHPAQYRTRLCKDGTSCARRVCFFAHTSDELRPLYVSTGSAVPSPRSSAMEMAAAMSLLSGSPSSVPVMSPTTFTPPMSPSGNGTSHSSLVWPQPNVPTLHLPGSNLQSSRLRSSFNARDIPTEDYSMLPEFDSQQLLNDQLLNDFSCFSQTHFSSSVGNRSVRSKTLTPSNLEDLFSAEMSSSPRYSDHKSAVLNQFQIHQQNMFSPINTNVFSPINSDQQLSGHPRLQTSFGLPSPGRISSPRAVESLSPLSSRVAAFAQREKLRSLSARDLGSGNMGIVGSPVNNSWLKWGSPAGKLDWGVNGEELGNRRSSSFELGSGGEEPDLSWVQSLVKESPPEIKEKTAIVPTTASLGSAPSGEGSNLESIDHSVLGAWLEQMQLDQLVA
ncbi:zinc finger CCCH domain-containing protein 30-like [Tasmannia lanceolata]|uniref:zinc finger CCCH domain-containing protein 30-like n=1 Tax=Tasmannia lanceolata TaxID=3420 RepID=UPI0040632F8F